MTDKTQGLDHPIDVMYPLHAAFHSISLRAEKAAAAAESGGDLNEFRSAFDLWVKQLFYHAEVEDRYMTPALGDIEQARDNVKEHDEIRDHGRDIMAFLASGETAGLEHNVRAAMAAYTEGVQHEQLMGRVDEVKEILARALGEDRVVARTRRHLHNRVTALRTMEYDHFENEEAFVLPLVRERLSQAQQLDVARRLIIEDEAEDPRWVIDWVVSELDQAGRDAIAGLASRFAPPTRLTRRSGDSPYPNLCLSSNSSSSSTPSPGPSGTYT